jgi:tRNA threonylcarbamoyladenosine biosynthesis protein TsaB
MTTILSFDTSADFCAAALVRADTALACDSLPMSRGHAEALVPLVQKLCAEAGIKLSDVDLIGATVGPGSFTGVRTGIAAAKGFALAAGCPAIGVSSLDAVALGAKDHAESRWYQRPGPCSPPCRHRQRGGPFFRTGRGAGLG